MSTEQERQEWARLAEYVIPTTFQAHFGHAIIALLADVDRLTGDNAALSEALDTALLHLKESEADRDKAVTMLGEEAIAHSRTRHERDALAGQLEEQGAEIDRLRRAIEDEYGCVPGEFDPFTFHEGPLFEGMP
jgi:hypothetical protein